jgi:hypothetical protein
MLVEKHFELGHFRRLYYVGRLYHEPMPTWPNADGIRYREALYPLLEPFDLKGVGFTYNRYIDPARQDDSWLYYPLLKRVRRLSTAARSEAFVRARHRHRQLRRLRGNIAWMDWKLLGTKHLLGAMHTENFPANGRRAPRTSCSTTRGKCATSTCWRAARSCPATRTHGA